VPPFNPLRAGIVDTLAKLDRQEWSGHSVVMNYRKNNWQDRKYFLRWFGAKEGEARRSYRAFVEEGMAMGDRPETDPILPYANFVFPGKPSHLLQVSEVIRILTYERFKDDLFRLSLDTFR